MEEKLDPRKTKKCPECGKMILKTSQFCGSCSQKGNRNQNYIDGTKSENRFCAICGNKISTASKRICSDCYQKTKLGKGNPNYRYGHYTDNFRSTKEYKEWKIFIFTRDRKTCAMCGKLDYRCDAHHILPKRDFPDLVYNKNNGVSLCRECHSKINKNEYAFAMTLFDKIEHIYKQERIKNTSGNS